jgi:hypothetical protein
MKYLILIFLPVFVFAQPFPMGTHRSEIIPHLPEPMNENQYMGSDQFAAMIFQSFGYDEEERLLFYLALYPLMFLTVPLATIYQDIENKFGPRMELPENLLNYFTDSIGKSGPLPVVNYWNKDGVIVISAAEGFGLGLFYIWIQDFDLEEKLKEMIGR